MASDDYVERDVAAVLNVDRFESMLGRAPALWRLVFAAFVEGLYEDIFDIGADVGESPSDALVVSDDDEWRAGQSDSGNIVVAALQLGLVPRVRNVMRRGACRSTAAAFR